MNQRIRYNKIDKKVNDRFTKAGATIDSDYIVYNEEILDKVVQSYVKDGFSIEDAKETVKAFIYFNRIR